MQITQAGYYFSPRRSGTDPLFGPLSSPGPEWSYASDIVAPFAPGYSLLYLPPDFPDNCLLNRFCLNAGYEQVTGSTNEIWMALDPGGVYYNAAIAGKAMEQGADIHRCQTLAHMRWAGIPNAHGQIFDWRVPILFDRTQGDKLILFVSCPDSCLWVSCNIGWLNIQP